MLVPIRDLSLHTFARSVWTETDIVGRYACTPKIEEMLEDNPRREQRLEFLRSSIGIAAMKCVASPTELQIEQPAVEAFIRTHRHSAMPPALPDLHVIGKGLGGPRLDEIARQHPDLIWDQPLVKELLWKALQAYGDHEVDESSPPGRMSWGPAAAAAQALVVFFTLEAMRLF